MFIFFQYEFLHKNNSDLFFLQGQITFSNSYIVTPYKYFIIKSKFNEHNIILLFCTYYIFLLSWKDFNILKHNTKCLITFIFFAVDSLFFLSMTSQYTLISQINQSCHTKRLLLSVFNGSTIDCTHFT